jgi:PAS domain S-box-containing protein
VIQSRAAVSPWLRQADFEVIAESIPHIVWLAGADGSTDYFNRLGTDYTGLPRQANYGWGWLALVHPEDADRARLGWEHATRTATPFELSYRIRRRDGEFRWHACRALPVRGRNGEVVKWIGTADDVDNLMRPQDEAGRIETQITEVGSLLATVQRVAGVNATLWAQDRAPAAPPPREHAADVGADTPATARLTPRELVVLRLVTAGHTNTEIAAHLGVSLRSVESSRSRIRQSLGLRTRAELVRFAYEAGLVDPHP